MNIAILLSYDGTLYHGWQTQKNAVTVCETLQKAIEKTVGHAVKLVGCGRTDAGVHADYYVANFEADTAIPLNKLPFALNSRLPHDISVRCAKHVSEDFNSITSCIKKEYTYSLYTGSHRRPLLKNRALHYIFSLDLEKARCAAEGFIGEHDFACVQSVGTPVKSTVRTVYEYEISQREEGVYTFRISANGFLYNMARAMVGTVLYYCEDKIGDIPELLLAKNRTNAGPTVPPYGLYMTHAWYGGGVDF